MNYSGNDTLSGINRMWMIFQFLVDKNRVTYNFLLFIRHMEHICIFEHIWTCGTNGKQARMAHKHVYIAPDTANSQNTNLADFVG